MAKVSGGAAYQRLQRLDNPEQQAAQFQIQNFEQRRYEGDKRKDADKAAIKKAYDDFSVTITGQPLDAHMTGMADLNQVNMNVALAGREKQYELSEKARQAYLNGNMAEANKYQSQMNKLQSSFKGYNDYLKKVDAVLSDAIANPDKYNQNDPSFATLQGMVKGDVFPRYDEDGRLKFLVKKDLDGDGEIGEEEYEEVDIMNPLQDVLSLQKNVELWGTGGALADEQKLMGVLIDEQAKNGRIVKTEGFDPTKRETLVNAMRTKMIDDAIVAKLLNNLKPNDPNRTLEVRGFTDEQRQKAAEIAADIAIASYKIDKSDKLDETAEKIRANKADETLAERKFAYDKQKDKKQLELDWYKALNPSGGRKGGDGKGGYTTYVTTLPNGKRVKTYSIGEEGFKLPREVENSFQNIDFKKQGYNQVVVTEDNKVYLANGKEKDESEMIELGSNAYAYIGNELGFDTGEEFIKNVAKDIPLNYVTDFDRIPTSVGTEGVVNKTLGEGNKIGVLD